MVNIYIRPNEIFVRQSCIAGFARSKYECGNDRLR
jgi:hypothetical protein